MATPSTVIPAQAGIHHRDASRKGGTVCALSYIVSGYGSRAPLRGPGMTQQVSADVRTRTSVSDKPETDGEESLPGPGADLPPPVGPSRRTWRGPGGVFPYA